MTIRFDNGWTPPLTVPGWPLTGEPHFAKSRAYRVFLRELRRYTIEEVSGRSFLIAGHRGAGKTALVTQAARELRTRLIQESVKSDTDSVSRRTRLQRPLIVKLVGHSLVAPPPKPNEEPAKKPKKKAKGSVQNEDDQLISKELPANEKDEAASALVHITIALYRALAAEVVQGFANHAREADRRHPGDRLELAAQFALDLDDAPDPALLRRRWLELGRLDHGILWPPLADEKLDNSDIADQGLREIIAVTTAAQAFQVCLGAVTWKKSSGEIASKEATLQSKVDVKDMIGRLGALFAGTAAGSVAAFHVGGPGAAGIGLLVWLASSVVMTRSGSRTSKKQQSLDYTFMRDRSVQTLDRDLPLVIERIRAAGLAPVFIIDELDKLDARTTIKTILNRLKHLMADYGFFCFLTGRDYYDEIERVVATQAYPNEHTFFSERMLVINSPLDLFAYVTGMLKSDSPDSDKLPIATFALSSIFASRLNFTELMRAMSRSVGEDGTLLLTADEFRLRKDLRLAAAFQLSVEEALRDERCTTRFRHDQGFAQLAVDTLYLIARRWEDSRNTVIDLSLEALEAYLLERSSGKAGIVPQGDRDSTARAGATLDSSLADPVEPTPHTATIAPVDFRMAHELLLRQIGYLVRFSSLIDALRSRAGPDEWRLTELVPLELGKDGLICAAHGEKSFQYRFLLDETGEAVADEKNEWLGEAAREDIDWHLKMLMAFGDLMATTSLTVDALVSVNVLPATLSSALVSNAENALKGAGLSQLRTDALQNGMTTARQLVRGLGDASALLSNLLSVIQMIYLRAEDAAGSAHDILQSLAGYLPALAPLETTTSRPASMVLGEHLPVAVELTSLEALDALVRTIKQMGNAQPHLTLGEVEIERLWMGWRDRVLAWIEEGKSVATDFSFEDLYCAALDRNPAHLFRADLASMGVIEWSRVALAGLSRAPDNQAPPWATIAALRVLGFDRKMLMTYSEQLPKAARALLTPAEREVVNRILRGAPDRPAGMLIISHTEPPPVSLEESRPMILVASSMMEEYEEGLNHLASQGAFEGVVNVVEE